MNKAWTTGMEEELMSCCSRGDQRSRQSRCSNEVPPGVKLSHMHEDDFDLSAGHHHNNMLHLSEPLREDFNLWEMKNNTRLQT